MNAVATLAALPARSLVEERAMRPPTIGRIRPGIKALTSSARANAQAVEIYREMVAAGDSFDTIAKVIESKCRVRNALAPKNVPYFTCRRSDFTNPDVADEILRLYGEDHGNGLKLYRFPVLFAFNDWMANLPNQMAAWGTTGRKYFSEYGSDGMRYCKTYAKVERDPRAQRAARSFGGRDVIFRQDDAIPDGICDPEQCPQYQARQCNLSASFIFAIPDIKGLGLIELPTNSIYVLQKAYSAMQTVLLARGKLTGTRFWITKREFDITRINDQGDAVRAKQMLTVLDADIDIGALLDGAEDSAPALDAATDAVALIEAGGNVHPLHAGEATRHAAGSDVGAGAPAGQTPAASTIEVGTLQTSQSHAAGASADEPEPGATEHLPGAESHEDKLRRMQDLLQRLGLSAENRKHDFRIYAHATFGRGWIDRTPDVDRMNEQLTKALTDRAPLDQEIENAKMAALYG
ncbi:recombination directionality factor [Paraburkholderia gardini]|uniref:recombination directionality factor n=1 Tax=Paraburkholderia gardini TaxID=2823469 RepID=UPI001D8B183D|nr:hypothetical protein [Paraburkholderia gardini]CAG4923414.1 hypothetical protein R69919_05100 [Paraburkholderia gardini]